MGQPLANTSLAALYIYIYYNTLVLEYIHIAKFQVNANALQDTEDVTVKYLVREGVMGSIVRIAATANMRTLMVATTLLESVFAIQAGEVQGI